MSGYENEERKTKFHELFATKIRISLVNTLTLRKTFLLLCHHLDLNRPTVTDRSAFRTGITDVVAPPIPLKAAAPRKPRRAIDNLPSFTLLTSMRESAFVRLNRQKWQSYQEWGQNMGMLNPEEMAKIYLDVSADLAFAQTHFAESPVTDYLERIARHFHQHVYGQRPNRWGEVVRTLKYDIPMAFYYSRRDLLVSLAVFLIAMVVGVLSQQMDPDFARSVLGDRYVDMTIQNVANGDPMAIYKDKDTVTMFWRIFLNNASIDARTFIAGLLALPGALLIILYNGVMFGCFETFLMQQGAVLEALFVVNLHGSLEIPTIILSGASALALGTGWLFPGRRSRIEAFRQGARRGLLMIMGVLPLTLVAALIETYITRHTEAPLALRVFFVFGGLLLVSWLTIFLPQRLHRNGHTL